MENDNISEPATKKAGRKRGFYNQYLHDNETVPSSSISRSKIPRTSKHRLLLKKKIAETIIQPVQEDQSSGRSDLAATTSNVYPLQASQQLHLIEEESSNTWSDDESESETRDDTDFERPDYSNEETISFSDIENHNQMAPETIDNMESNQKFLQSKLNDDDKLDDPALFSDDDDVEDGDDCIKSNSQNEDPEEDKDDGDTNTLENELGGDQPIYDGARLTLSVSIMLILTFIMRHHLTGVAVDDLIALIEAHMIVPNLCKTTMKLIRRFFAKVRENVVFHYFCGKCLVYIGLEDKSCAICNKKCNANPYFIVIPLLDNLQSLFKYKGFLQDLSYPTSRQKKSPENIEDIIDGEVYTKHFGSDGFLNGTSSFAKTNEIHISLQCNTDGVSLFKSSKMEIWPIYYTINELHPMLRYRRKYRLFAGLWFSDKKPDFKTFLKPFAEELKEFGTAGKSIMTEKGKKLLKVFLFSGIFDAPAKSMFQNIVQFNGLYGCSYCLEPGETCKAGKGHVHAFPFNYDKIAGHTNLRSHNGTITHGKEASTNISTTGKITPEKGIKGLSWSMTLPRFNVINGLGIDYLHNTLLGVVKMIMKLWFNKKYKNMPWFIGTSVTEIDKNIRQLRLPNLISRIPRNIEHDFKHFKGSEFRTFLLFYSAPILYNFLPDEYFQHYILLVESIFLLLKESISPIDLQNADKMLRHFCCRIPRLYGYRYQTYNMHNLLHMVFSVKQHGPLWAQSAFWYEDYNGDYKNLYHGTQNVNIQIVTNVIVQHKIPEIVQSLTPGTVGYSLYNKMTVKYHQNTQKLGENIAAGIYCVGNLVPANCCQVVEALIKHHFSPKTDVFSFKRICFNGLIIQSKSYLRVIKRNTYTVKYNGRYGVHLGFIDTFLKLTDSNDKIRFLAVMQVPKVKKCEISKDAVAKLNHMVPISPDITTYDICNITDIKEVCCFVQGGNGMDFIIEFPNRIEKD
ncbi:uncharacterized protein [Clytia hemisphaerica]|uniref:Transposase domain-containing protein n=1 Tax=Clytia hemisphaerica TaxID=252671 RepID=A0A7M5X4I6_9CNID